MNRDRWLRIKELFGSTVELDSGQRAAYLEKACHGDEELRMEVERLIAADSQDPEFLESSAVEEVAESIVENVPGEIEPGRLIGHYIIVKRLGAGGMGQVYQAEDQDLGRKVALKLLSDDLLANPKYFSRLKQEASAASALNHPNILTIYEFGTADGVSFIVTEYIEGETLRARLDKLHHQAGTPLTSSSIPASSVRWKIRDLLDIAIQVSSALTAAHG